MAVLDRLRDLDEVAYLRFASVYKGFEEPTTSSARSACSPKSTPPGPIPRSARPPNRPIPAPDKTKRRSVPFRHPPGVSDRATSACPQGAHKQRP